VPDDPAQRAIAVGILFILSGLLAMFFGVEGLHADVHLVMFVPWMVLALFAVRAANELRSGRVHKSGATRAIAVLVLALGTLSGALAVCGALTAVDPHVTTRNRAYCGFHLQALGAALDEFAVGHAGKYPDSLRDLHERSEESLARENLVCPGTHERGREPTTQEVFAGVTDDGSVSYVYIGRGVSRTCPSATILAYDRPGNHSHDGGRNVTVFLRADGTIEMAEPRRARKLLAELKAGFNPPRP
jgi:hypothetical protein